MKENNCLFLVPAGLQDSRFAEKLWSMTAVKDCLIIAAHVCVLLGSSVTFSLGISLSSSLLSIPQQATVSSRLSDLSSFQFQKSQGKKVREPNRCTTVPLGYESWLYLDSWSCICHIAEWELTRSHDRLNITAVGVLVNVSLEWSFYETKRAGLFLHSGFVCSQC